MLKLYHGSNVEVRKPSLLKSRKNTDFGRGFYTTTQKEQAEHWTSIKMDRAKKGRRVVSVFEVDETILSNLEFKIREFRGPDEACLNFVVNSRKGIEHDYDLVFGPVANDKVFTVVNLYESGIINATTAIAELKAYNTYDQLSFHTERVIKELRFVESYEVKTSKH